MDNIINTLELNIGKTVYDLGTDTSFNIQTLVPTVDYTTLTVDNFMCSSISSVSNLHSSRSSWCDNNAESAVWVEDRKSYDSTTGVLSWSVFGQGGIYGGCNTGCTGFKGVSTLRAVHAYLIV